MRTNKILWKVEDERGVALTGFKTKEEAERQLPLMKENHDWKVKMYYSQDWELNN